ncbi:tRNA modification GTPase trmE [Desulfacinum hydrothermale DSM 13146]|uniref:tRNA modification GTPase MnmE n=1 Tax=Desulfacinum hydrothermale DSM 13146 TaxID=1121390 RepID=A0A1W1XJ88_9BACT|nr:tRNA uridine-5-carboxymethylaminomethyl(34) synthesis GTPase MnmE [Desulfacinum hydrothermale]SMC23568.1 tRNA modification GTPase trmE [Desulfacinum hydrothermale DSM 13146]
MDIACRRDTICAIATPIGIGGIGILKISGADALRILRTLFVTRTGKPRSSFPSHRLCHGWIRDPKTLEPVDEVLASYMAAPRTYTGEDVVEINCHSGYAVLNRMLEIVVSQGARVAEPGEFTQRAFLSGRLDLSQAEAVADIIHSRSQEALKQAGRHLRGDFGREVSRWREHLMELEAQVEAHLDFAEDLSEEGDPALAGLLSRVETQVIPALERIVSHYEEGRVLREGLSMVLVGKPNVGKSSLLNALVGRDRAIVTAMEGTTRDVVEDSFWVAGVEVRVLDTAGIRQKPDAIESMGIERTLRSVDEADLVLWILDHSRPLTEDDDRIHERISGKRVLVVLNKMDRCGPTTAQAARTRYGLEGDVVELCALRPEDAQRLKKILQDRVLKEALLSAESTFAVNRRQRDCLARALEALQRACALPDPEAWPELVSEELRAARKELDAILGLEADEELLDRIFSRFCIGK